MTNIQKAIGFVIAGVVVGMLLSSALTSRDANTGGVYSNVQQNFSEGIAVTGAITGTGAATIDGDATIGGGTFNVTTSNSATSTIVAGCWEFYATSTATALRFLASTTPRAMVYEYGACPRL